MSTDGDIEVLSKLIASVATHILRYCLDSHHSILSSHRKCEKQQVDIERLEGRRLLGVESSVFVRLTPEDYPVTGLHINLPPAPHCLTVSRQLVLPVWIQIPPIPFSTAVASQRNTGHICECSRASFAPAWHTPMSRGTRPYSHGSRSAECVGFSCHKLHRQSLHSNNKAQ